MAHCNASRKTKRKFLHRRKLRYTLAFLLNSYFKDFLLSSRGGWIYFCEETRFIFPFTFLLFQAEKHREVERRLNETELEEKAKLNKERNDLLEKRREKERELKALQRKKAIIQYVSFCLVFELEHVQSV